jgi:hypothetical protein
MKEIKPFCVALIAAYLLGASSVYSQTPVGGLYEIKSGSYVEKGGIVGIMQYPLPNTTQAFLQLTADSKSGDFELTVLGADLRPGWFPKLTNGVVTGNTIRFQYLTMYPSWPEPPAPIAAVDYTLTNDAGALRLSGSITSVVVCCDIPYDFQHQSVVAMLATTPNIRVSEVELCWSSLTNKNYLVQYRSELTTNQWTNLGGPMQGQAVNTCIADKVPAGQPRRFYRILALP